MGWAAVAAEGLGVRGCCSLPVASAKSSLGRPTIVASKTTRPRRRVNGSPPRKQQPSVAEVQKAIGVVDDPFRSPDGASSSSSSSSPFLGFLQDESPAERKLRKAAEWVVDSTEAQAQSGTPVTLPVVPSLAQVSSLLSIAVEEKGQRILLLVCLNILPVWLLLLLVASGVIKLPFDLPFWNDIIS